MDNICTGDLGRLTPMEYRSLVRKGEWTGSSMEACCGWALTDMVIVPKDYAVDFFLFCHRNPQLCPLVDVTEVGSPHPRRVAPDADLRTDLPRYQVFKDGKLIDEPTNILNYWRDDLVAFLTGCSLAFDWALLANNVQYRSIGAFASGIPCVAAGPFRGNMVVSARLFASARDVIKAIQITSRYMLAHGAPIHIGDPEAIGIKDLSRADRIVLPGKIDPPKPGEIALYWPTGGATMRDIAKDAKLPLMIVDYPRSGFITDLRSEELAIF